MRRRPDPRRRAAARPVLALSFALSFALSVATALFATTSVARAAEAAPFGFFTAIQRDDDVDVRTYLLRGTSHGARDENGTPALVMAAEHRSSKVVQSLLAIPGVDVGARNGKGESALMFSALHGQVDAVARLIELGAEVNQPGWSALHYAATGGSLPVVRLLLEHHAYIDAESPNRTTPLMMAARHGHELVTRYLVEQGADPSARNDSGLTAADYAHGKRNAALAEWLVDQSRAFRTRYGLPPLGAK